MNETIFALSSGRPPAAIAVMRISGGEAVRIATELAGSLPNERQAGLRRLRDRTGATLDRALVLRFARPASATGEDLIELHLHGARAVVSAVSAALEEAGARPAIAGEFTRRALANGRIDLAEAEGLADLLVAETEAQRRAALDGAEGAVSRRVRGWLDRIAALSALVEAQLDYGDEGDVLASDRDVESDIRALAAEMRDVLDQPSTERLRDGVRVVLAGPPNAGKSTLLNLLGEREAAIVSPVAGTTRDRIEMPVARNGVPYLLIDTAGLAQHSDDPVERIGIARTREAMGSADLLLWLDDRAPPAGGPVVAVHARADLPGRERVPTDRIAVSRYDDRSVFALWAQIETAAAALLPTGDRLALNARQHRLCGEAAGALTAAQVGSDLLLAGEALRVARGRLSELLGYSATDVLLDALFGRFCIGK